MRLFALIFAGLLCCGNALADNLAQPIVVKDVAKFLDYQRDLRVDMQGKSKFKHVDESSKRRLFAAQDTLFAVLKDKQSINELDDEQRIAVYNAQAEITAVLTDAELDRPVCKREKPIGSNMMKTICITKRESREMQERQKANGLRTRACDNGECSG